MWKNIKKGFGLAIGWSFGEAIVGVIGTAILRSSANDKKYVDGLKERRPDLYEELKKYQTKKEESVEETEEEES